MTDIPSFFITMVDELVGFADYDPELAEALKWLDRQAQQKGVTFYEMVFDALHRYEVNIKAKEWMANRN